MRFGWVGLVTGVVSLFAACTSAESNPEEDPVQIGSCPSGSMGCRCYGNQTCDEGLSCMGGTCAAANSGGAAGNSGGAGGMPATMTQSCSGCAMDQVCNGGACVDIPDDCPCPVETYCDLATMTCVRGCISDDGCDAGRICHADQRRCEFGCREDAACARGSICEALQCVTGCRDDAGCEAGNICEGMQCGPGCRDDAGCPAGQICEALACRPGCREDANCPVGQVCAGDVCVQGCRTSGECAAVTGSSCVDAACRCPAGELPCRGACVDTTSNNTHCGTCERPCGGGRMCVNSECSCPAGSAQCGSECKRVEGQTCSTDADCCQMDGAVCFGGACLRPYELCSAHTECASNMCFASNSYCIPSCTTTSCPSYVDQTGATRSVSCTTELSVCVLNCSATSDCPPGLTCYTNFCMNCEVNPC